MAVPSGIILIWSGAIVDIPAGWKLCDGTGGTPDLRDRFVIGAGSTYAVNATGGTTTHTHAFTGNGHTHDLPAGDRLATGSGRENTTAPTNATGTTDNGSSLPPYYALAFIRKT